MADELDHSCAKESTLYTYPRYYITYRSRSHLYAINTVKLQTRSWFVDDRTKESTIYYARFR